MPSTSGVSNVNPGQLAKKVNKVRRHEQGGHVNYGKMHDAQRDNPQSLNPQIKEQRPSYASQNFSNNLPMLDEPLWVTVDEGEADMHKLVGIADIIREGGVGIIPTDTYPAIVCDVHNQAAVDRLYSVKHLKRTRQLSLLCRSLSDIGQYTAGFPAPYEPGQQNLFPLVKDNVPGPFTFLLTASKKLPKQSLPYKNTKSRYRKTVGVRLPDHQVCKELLEHVDGPLLCTSCHVVAEDDLDVEVMTGEKLLEAYPDVDFMVDPGETWITQGSTVLDFTGASPKVLRLGMGDPRVFGDYFPASKLEELQELGQQIEEQQIMV